MSLFNLRGLSRNPLFYFGFFTFILLGMLYSSCDSSVNLNGLSSCKTVFFNSFFNNSVTSTSDSLFSSTANAIPLETPDLKIIQDNAVYGISTPQIVSGKVLGDTFGSMNQNQKDVADYIVQPGDTVQSIADQFKISPNTILWANDMSSASSMKVGQTLAILPVDGVLHVVKSGDTMAAISQRYKAKSDDVIAFNSLANQDDLYVGDILVVPGGIMPKSAPSLMSGQAPLPNNYFIFPAQGHITQGLHYFNAVDLANKCGTPIYAAAAGVVQRAVGNGGWNSGMGNHITILHSNGTVTYYGHLMALLVKSGDRVYTGQNIGLMGGGAGMPGAGNSTGCHVHFEVIGARNPLARYPIGSSISYK